MLKGAMNHYYWFSDSPSDRTGFPHDLSAWSAEAMLSSGNQEEQIVSLNFQSGDHESIPSTTITEQSSLISRSTSPIDGRVIRLLLGEIVEGNFHVDTAQLDKKRHSPRRVHPSISKSRGVVKSSPMVVARVDHITSPKYTNSSDEGFLFNDKFTGRALQHDELSTDRVNSGSSATLLQNKPSKSHVVDMLLTKIQEIERREAGLSQFLQKTVEHRIESSKQTISVSSDALRDNLSSTPSTSIPGFRSQSSTRIPDSRCLLQQDNYASPDLRNSNDARNRYATPSSVQFDLSKKEKRLSSTGTGDGISPRTESLSHGFSSNIHGRQCDVMRFGATLPNQWRAPKLYDTNETAIMSGIKMGHTDLRDRALGTQDIDIGLLSLLGATVTTTPHHMMYNRPTTEVLDGSEDLAAMRRQQAALDSLPRFTPTLQLQQDIKEFKKDLRIAREMRESAFRARGVTMVDTVRTISDAIADELVEQTAAEIDLFVEHYADKFLQQI